MKNFCGVCNNSLPKFIISCGCFLCQDCYEVAKSFIDGDTTNCLSCGKNFVLSMTIDINKKSIENQINKYNTAENNKLILEKLKVINKY